MIKKALGSVALCAVLGAAFLAGSLHHSHEASLPQPGMIVSSGGYGPFGC